MRTGQWTVVAGYRSYQLFKLIICGELVYSPNPLLLRPFGVSLDSIALVAMVQGKHFEGVAVTALHVRDSKFISLSEEQEEGGQWGGGREEGSRE